MAADAAAELLATFEPHSSEWAVVNQLIGYRTEYKELQRELATPPVGWFPFGHHVDRPDVPRLEFWGDHGDIPLWERPVPADEQTRDLIEAAIHDITPNVTNETHAWNLWNALNTSPAFIAAFEEMRRRAPRMEET